MLQVATYKVPEQVQEANDFLAEHKTSAQGGINFNKDTIVIFYDDGTYPVAHERADWVSMLRGTDRQVHDQHLALHVLELDLVKYSRNPDAVAEINKGIKDCKDSMTLLEQKRAFVQAKIDELDGKTAAPEKEAKK